MYLEWMKKHLLIITSLQFCLIVFIIITNNQFQYEIFLATVIGGVFFGVMQYFICRFVYKDSISLKLNLLLVMWDIFFYISAIMVMSIEKFTELTPMVNNLFLIRTELVIYAKRFKILGKK